MRFFWLLLLVTGCGVVNENRAPANKYTDAASEQVRSDEEGDEPTLVNSTDSYEELVSHSSAPSFTLRGIAYHGNGCPQNSVGATISEDKKAFTLIFDQNIVDLEAAQRIQHKRVDCFIQLAFNVPAGWSFGILSTQIRGYVDIDEGVFAQERLSLYTKYGYRSIHEKMFRGAKTEDYVSESKISLRAVSWTPCRPSVKSLALRTSLMMHAHKGSGGVLAMDSADGELSQNYKIAWRRCR